MRPQIAEISSPVAAWMMPAATRSSGFTLPIRAIAVLILSGRCVRRCAAFANELSRKERLAYSLHFCYY